MSGDLYTLALSVPWLMEPLALEALLSIAAREPLPEDEIARRMHGDKALALRTGESRDDSRRMTMRDGVAIIPVDGPIYRYADFFTNVSGGITTEALARDFGIARDDPAVRGIVFVINSPGGEVVGINELAEKIYEARGSKPTAAYVEGIGASAAYWIASAADVVYLDDTARVGSIGTVIGVSDPTKQTTRTIEFVSSQSPKKRANPTTDDGRAYYQSLADATTEVFLEKVARNRGIKVATLLAVEGGLLTGQQAVTAGLADALGSEEGTIRALLSDALTMPNLRTTRNVFPVQSTPARAQQEVFPMAVDQKGFWAGFFGGAKDAGIITEASAEPAAQAQAPAAPAQPTQQQPDPEVARLRAELIRLRGEQIQKDAAAFVVSELAASRAYPAEKDALIALYAQCAADDAAHPPTAADALNGQYPPTRVALITAWASARPAHTLTKPTLPSTPQGTVLTTGGTDDAAELDRAEVSARKYAERANGKRA